MIIIIVINNNNNNNSDCDNDTISIVIALIPLTQDDFKLYNNYLLDRMRPSSNSLNKLNEREIPALWLSTLKSKNF